MFLREMPMKCGQKEGRGTSDKGTVRICGPSRTTVPTRVRHKALISAKTIPCIDETKIETLVRAEKQKIQFARIGFYNNYSLFTFIFSLNKKVPALPWGPVITCGSRRWVASPLLLCFQHPIRLYDLTGRPAIHRGSPASRIRNVGPNGPNSTNRAGILNSFGKIRN